MDLGIQGKTALVFGGDSGIGWNTARILLAEGATVVVTDIDQADSTTRPTSSRHRSASCTPSPRTCGAPRAWPRCTSKVREAVGEIDILVQSSGVTGAQGMFHEIDEAGWAETIDVDLMGPVRITREFIADLRKGGWGRIVYLVSEDASQPYDDELPYCAAKAGVLSFAKGLSRTYAKEGLLVNTVCPAFIHTPMTDAMMKKRAKQTRHLRRGHHELPRRGAAVHGAQAPRRAGRGRERRRVPVLRARELRERLQLPGRLRLGRHDLTGTP